MYKIRALSYSKPYAQRLFVIDFIFYSMDFKVRLELVHTNAHDAKLYKDPIMNRWVVKIEEHPTAFDPSPWVNYQGEMYVGQEGSCYQVAKEP